VVTEQTARPRRKSFAEQSFGDLLRSIILLLLIIGAVWAVNTVVSPDDEQLPVRAVQYQEQLVVARNQADYPVLAPRGLAGGWVPTSVDLQSSGGTLRWHLGFLTPAKEYVGLEQGDVKPQALALRHTGDLQRSGTVAIEGRPWRLYHGETDTALVHRRGDVITIVVGTANAEVLMSFARSLA
jgi:hypothetical protein